MAKRILVVTNRPAIANSWYDDYVKFVGTDSGWRFISSVDALAGRPYCISHDEYLHLAGKGKLPNSIEFISLQDLKGSIEFGGHYDKLKYVAEYEYDLLVIDEAHEGVDTYKTDVAFDHIKRRNTLHLSGTPFKAIANDKFPEDGKIRNAATRTRICRNLTCSPTRCPTSSRTRWRRACRSTAFRPNTRSI